jgi:hypothetical protein
MRLRLLAAAALMSGRALAQPAPAAPAPAPAAPVGPPGTVAPETGADYRPPPRRAKDIVVTVEGTRSRNNVLALSATAGVAVVLGAVGLYYNLDARSASNDVSAGTPQNVPWTPARQAEYDRAHDSSVKAEVFYGIGGAVLAGAIVALIVTAPQDQTVVIHPRVGVRAVRPIVAPTAGGAFVGGAWRF